MFGMSLFNVGPPTLVLRKFSVDENNAQGNFIEVEGRPAGFFSWLMTLLRLEALTTLRLESDRLLLKSSSWLGETHKVMPLGSIEITDCGYSKKFWLLALAIGSIIMGATSDKTGAFIFFMIIGLILGGLYHFSKRMFVTASCGGGEIAIAYKKGAIEGLDVDFDATLKLIELLNKKIVDRQNNELGFLSAKPDLSDAA